VTNVSTIERLPDESARAFRARTEYVMMGPDRSLDKLRQRIGKSAAYTRQLEEWSSRYDWGATARAWDDQQAASALHQASEAYRADLADYRKRYGDMGKALYRSAAKMLRKINAKLDDPKTELGAGALLTALNAAKTAADLEALALRVENLLNTESDERSL
jgi:hypothetical protein